MIQEITVKSDNPFERKFIINNKGFIEIFIMYDRVEINNLEVNKKYRRQGLGNELLNFVVKISKKNKYKNISLEVNVNNKPAINLYKKNGFKIVSIRKNYYNGIDGYLMIKKIGE